MRSPSAWLPAKTSDGSDGPALLLCPPGPDEEYLSFDFRNGSLGFYGRPFFTRCFGLDFREAGRPERRSGCRDIPRKVQPFGASLRLFYQETDVSGSFTTVLIGTSSTTLLRGSRCRAPGTPCARCGRSCSRACRRIGIFGESALKDADWRFSKDLCSWAEKDAVFGPGFPPKEQAVLLGINHVAPKEK